MTTYITLNELRAKLGNRSRSAIYTDLEAGRLPPPLKLGGRLYWHDGELDAHLRELYAADATQLSGQSPFHRSDEMEGS